MRGLKATMRDKLSSLRYSRLYFKEQRRRKVATSVNAVGRNYGANPPYECNLAHDWFCANGFRRISVKG
jgi:hypothetical protein